MHSLELPFECDDSSETNEEQTNVVIFKTENSVPEYVVLDKDRQKKDNHNMIERRRRYNINDRIKELGMLLPKPEDQYHELVQNLRRNKGTILRASVAYMKLLKRDSETIPLMERRQRQLELNNRKLLYRVKELECLLQGHGIAVSPSPQLDEKEIEDITPPPTSPSSASGGISPLPSDASPISGMLHNSTIEEDLNQDPDLSGLNSDPMFYTPNLIDDSLFCTELLAS